MTAARKLRELLKGNETLIAPGAYDAWTARLIAESGFPVVYMTGFVGVGVSWGYRSTDVLWESGADVMIDEPWQLCELLDR